MALEKGGLPRVSECATYLGALTPLKISLARCMRSYFSTRVATGQPCSSRDFGISTVVMDGDEFSVLRSEIVALTGALVHATLGVETSAGIDHVIKHEWLDWFFGLVRLGFSSPVCTVSIQPSLAKHGPRNIVRRRRVALRW